MLDAQTVKRIEALVIRSRRRVTDVFSGEYRSAVRGSGLEFEEFREYSPGDDIRRIDWNVSARMDHPFVKVHREERERTVFILLDISKSLSFGGVKKKLAVAQEIAALLAYVAGFNKDRVSLILFTDEIIEIIPPGKGMAHVWHVMARLIEAKPVSVKTNLVPALEYHARVAPRNSMCFVVSDFLADHQDYLRTITRRHEYVFIKIFDPMENSMKKIPAMMSVEDLESGEVLNVGPARKLASDHWDSWKTLSRRMREKGIHLWELNCARDYIAEFITCFRTYLAAN